MKSFSFSTKIFGMIKNKFKILCLGRCPKLVKKKKKKERKEESFTPMLNLRN